MEKGEEDDKDRETQEYPSAELSLNPEVISLIHTEQCLIFILDHPGLEVTTPRAYCDHVELHREVILDGRN